MLEMCLQNYKLMILDGGFLCHAHRTIHVYSHLTVETKAKTKILNTYRYSELARRFLKEYGTFKKHSCRCYDYFSKYVFLFNYTSLLISFVFYLIFFIYMLSSFYVSTFFI